MNDKFDNVYKINDCLQIGLGFRAQLCVLRSLLNCELFANFKNQKLRTLVPLQRSPTEDMRKSTFSLYVRTNC